MKLSTREDIKVPIDAAFRAVTDFDGIERRLVARGIPVTRTGDLEPGQLGALWIARVPWRNRIHDLEAELVMVDPGQGVAVESRVAGLVCLGVVDLLALSEGETRLFASVDVRPTTMSSRLLLQSLRLMRRSLARRFRDRVASLAAGIGG